MKKSRENLIIISGPVTTKQYQYWPNIASNGLKRLFLL